MSPHHGGHGGHGGHHGGHHGGFGRPPMHHRRGCFGFVLAALAAVACIVLFLV